MRVNFISSKDTGEIPTIYIWSDNKNIMWNNETDNIIKELFQYFLDNYRKEEQIMRGGSDFIFESVELIDYKLHKIRLKGVGSLIESPEWLKNTGATINPKNRKGDKCFQYPLTLALNYNKIKKKELEKIFKKIKRKDIDFLSHQRVWKNFEKKNESITLNVLFSSQNNEEKTLVYNSEHNFERENNAVLLMINDDAEKYYYFAVKSRLELYSSEWLRNKKEAIINGDNCSK